MIELRAGISETRVPVLRPRPIHESCSLDVETDTETMNLIISVTRPRLRPIILVSRSRLRTRPRLNANNCDDICPHQGPSMEINHKFLFYFCFDQTEAI